ncbi:MAG TPA: hypothetical protein VHW72_17355 [Candidatus Angelobacter sp.]|jgi:hypothetical protein|nr:hypothetical protein [Candidatus Angelobacter sp.]
MSQAEETALRLPTKSHLAPFTANEHLWNAGTCFAFRLVFAYEILYSFPFPLNLLPWSEKIFGWYDALFNSITVWAGAHVLRLSSPLAYSFYSGGGSIFGWVQNLVKVTLAVAAAVIWTLLDRKRPSYRSMQEWLWLYVRLVLGAAMISYGAIKVIKVQFRLVSLAAAFSVW